MIETLFQLPSQTGQIATLVLSVFGVLAALTKRFRLAFSLVGLAVGLCVLRVLAILFLEGPGLGLNDSTQATDLREKSEQSFGTELTERPQNGVNTRHFSHLERMLPSIPFGPPWMNPTSSGTEQKECYTFGILRQNTS